jgi:phosphotransferase system, enzyme I, PtsP
MTVTEILRRIVQEVMAGDTLEDSLNTLMTSLVEQFGCDASSIFFSDDEKGEYVLAAQAGFGLEKTQTLRLPYGKGVLGVVAEREEIINLDNFNQHPAYEPHKDYIDSAFNGYMGVPVVASGNLVAVVVLYRQEARKFSEKTLSMAMTLSVLLANRLAQAYAKGQSLTEVKKGRRKEQAYYGQPGSAGVGIGTAQVVFPEADLDAVPDQPAGDVGEQIARFEQALTQAREEMTRLQQQAKKTLSAAESAIFDAYLRILDSRTFINQVIGEIEKDQWAEASLRRVVRRQVSQFESLEDPYLRDRAGDFLDLGQRILFFLQTKERASIEYPEKTVLVSEDVTATALMEVPPGKLVAVVSVSGSSNSHVSILARAMGVPAVMGLQAAQIVKFQSRSVIVDGYNGQVYVSPSRVVAKEFKNFSREEAELDAELHNLRDEPAQSTDGCRFTLLANTGLAEGGASLRVGAEGIGLYRTEMPFMVAESFPSENEQYHMYRRILQTFSPRPVYMRTLDAGGDKPLPYFHWEEDNPALGWRGVRVTLDHPEIFLQQIRAMLRANEGLGNLSITLPMISGLHEVDSCLRLIIQAHKELQEEGLTQAMPPLGSMIEVPAAVYQSYELAKRLDYLSVGSNDLTQYLLAVDRNNAQVAKLYDGLHPAVLRALNETVKSGHRAGRPVGICGELTSDPLAVVLLMGMGFDSLSMNARMLPRIKWVIRSFSSEEARLALESALQMDDAREVRLHLEGILDAAGLGGLIRAGRK